MHNCVKLLILFFSPLLVFGKPSPQDFVTVYNKARFTGVFSELNTSHLNQVRQLQYVFVAGFLNEGICGYFEDNIATLRALGVAETKIHSIFPRSNQGVEQNASELYERLFDLSRQGSPLVVVGHSKGALETLIMALKKTDFVSSRLIRAIFLIQGALGGSGVADFMLHGQPKVDSKMPRMAAWVFRSVASLENTIEGLIKPGLKSLETETTKNLINGLLSDHPDSAPVVGEKIFYIRGWEEPGHLPSEGVTSILKPTALYLKNYFCKSETQDKGHQGLNDGLVCLEDQSIDGLGTVLLTLPADHADLTAKWPISNQQRKIRQALTSAIFQSLAK